jgi:adenine-specific DNA-methyltransferase
VIDTKAAPSSLLASDELVLSLSQFAHDAMALSDGRDGQAAFELWSATSGGEAAGDEAQRTFASEAAFAGAARAVLAHELGRDSGNLREAYPHLYGSPLFSWYEPKESLRQELAAALELNKSQDPIELLGWLYQFAIPLEVRKRFGQFYTQPAIVNSMLDGVAFRGQAVLSGRFIDPACGAGAFVIEATRRVIAAAEEADLDASETYGAVQRCIHGLDLNPLGILLTEAAIALLLAERFKQIPEAEQLPPLHLYVTDTLTLEGLDAEAHNDVVCDIKGRSGAYASGFAFVVANPPYAKYRSSLLSDEQRERFAKTLYGHPNLYGLFLQIGVELLGSEGHLAFINPKSFVSGLYFRNLRRFLSEQLDLQRFDTFEKRTGLFEGVLQDVVILTGQKRSERGKTIELREFAGPPDQKPSSEIEAAMDSVLLGESFDRAFFITADKTAHAVLKRMQKSKPLSELGYEVITGTIVWNRLKDHVRDAASADALPLVWGNGVREFRFVGLGNRSGRATHMALVPKTKNIVSHGNAILTKRLTAKEEIRRIVACRVPPELANSDRGYFGENHVNIIRPTTEKPSVPLDAVLGLLNSSLYDYVFRALNGNTQVSATELEMLPVAEGPGLDEIAKLARDLTKKQGADPKMRAELDQAVFKLYGLSPAEIAELTGTTLAA